jgi:hypothetical protein
MFCLLELGISKISPKPTKDNEKEKKEEVAIYWKMLH